MVREEFERVVRNKSIIGDAFTMEDVADVMQVDPKILSSSWMRALETRDVVRRVGSKPSRNKKHPVVIWQGPYYLDLEAEEQAASPHRSAA